MQKKNWESCKNCHFVKKNVAGNFSEGGPGGHNWQVATMRLNQVRKYSKNALNLQKWQLIAKKLQ